MLWQRLFASLDADRGNHDLILGTAYGALLYFALYAIPQAVTAFQKWFDSWKFPQTVYRIDAEDETGKTVWQSSHNPTTQPTGAA